MLERFPLAQPLVYLAGPIAGCTDAQCNDWREEATAALKVYGIGVLNPMRRDYRGRRDISPYFIVDQDLDDIRNSDVVLVNTTMGPSWGTAMEFVHAKYLNKPVVAMVAIGEFPSPWVTCHSKILVASLKNAVGWCLQLLST